MKDYLKEKSYLLAVKTVRLYQSLVKEKKEYIISKQVLRSGTAIGALICEGKFAQSSKDFVNKFSIALKEANETNYWLNLLHDTEYISTAMHQELNQLCNELVNMLISSINTTKRNQKQ